MGKGWMELLRGGNAGKSAVVAGGMILHALNTFIVATILPSVVHEIGGLAWFAWSTVLYITASLIGAAFCARLLARVGARPAYRLALATFAIGSVACALAPAMGVLLAGRLVQGLGAGTLSALSFTMVRTLFPQPMWTRAFGVVSVTWGTATLLGPAVGGMFAQGGGWRLAFWTVGLAAPLLLALVEFALPRGLPRPKAPSGAIAFASLLILCASVVAVSFGGTAVDGVTDVVAVVAALAGLLWFARRDARGPARVLPRGATSPGTPLSATFAAMLLLMGATTPEIFVPYFLQVLHGMTPLHAGYLSALMAAGWTLASLASANVRPGTARIILTAGPVTQAAGLAILALLMPYASEPGLALVPIGAAMFGIGCGIGMCWPHLAARVFGFAQESDRELAGASITMVVMVGGAFGAALGGVATNLGGMAVPGGVEGASSAAAALFTGFLLLPLLAALAIQQLPTLVRPAAA